MKKKERRRRERENKNERESVWQRWLDVSTQKGEKIEIEEKHSGK